MIADTSFELREDLGALWAAYAPRIARAGASPDRYAGVAAALLDGRAFATLCEDGLVIFSPRQLPDGTIDAFLLLGVSNSGSHGAFARQEPHLLAIARELGATRLTFRTDRRGWKRLLGSEWRQDGETFTRSV